MKEDRAGLTAHLGEDNELRTAFSFWNMVWILVLGIAVFGCGSKEEKSIDVYKEALSAIAAGDKDKALDLLDRSIAANPMPFAYYQRAQIHLERDDAAAAIADCEKGLELAPNDRDLKWYLEECKKEPAKRFKGKSEKPPSAKK